MRKKSEVTSEILSTIVIGRVIHTEQKKCNLWLSL